MSMMRKEILGIWRRKYELSSKIVSPKSFEVMAYIFKRRIFRWHTWIIKKALIQARGNWHKDPSCQECYLDAQIAKESNNFCHSGSV